MRLLHRFLDKFEPKIPTVQWVYSKGTILKTLVNNPVYRYLRWSEYTLWQKVGYVISYLRKQKLKRKNENTGLETR